jgi:hypothetical protein
MHQALSRLVQKFSLISSIEEKEKKALEFLQNIESELKRA